MSDSLDAVLVHALRDRSGRPAIAALRRYDEDFWDWLVVGKDRQPLVFWQVNGTAQMQGIVRSEDGGSMLMVLNSTPPGVEPAGIAAVPASERRSPLAKMITIVTEDGETMISPPNHTVGPPPAVGPRMLDSLFDQFAYREKQQFLVQEVDTADDKRAGILLDWDKRPLLFWLTMPGKPESTYELFTAVAASNGISAVAVDGLLRPIRAIEETE
jgi:hypothetical protein